MIFAKLNATGLLSDIRQGPQQPGGVWPDGSQDVALVAMPSGAGPFGYDAVNKVAVPLPSPTPRRQVIVWEGYPSPVPLTLAQGVSSLVGRYVVTWATGAHGGVISSPVKRGGSAVLHSDTQGDSLTLAVSNQGAVAVSKLGSLAYYLVLDLLGV